MDLYTHICRHRHLPTPCWEPVVTHLPSSHWVHARWLLRQTLRVDVSWPAGHSVRGQQMFRQKLAWHTACATGIHGLNCNQDGRVRACPAETCMLTAGRTKHTSSVLPMVWKSSTPKLDYLDFIIIIFFILLYYTLILYFTLWFSVPYVWVLLRRYGLKIGTWVINSDRL